MSFFLVEVQCNLSQYIKQQTAEQSFNASNIANYKPILLAEEMHN